MLGWVRWDGVVLSEGQRLGRAADFRLAMREGSKAGTRTAVVYLVKTGDANSMTGFAVSRAVGGALTGSASVRGQPPAPARRHGERSRLQ